MGEEDVNFNRLEPGEVFRIEQGPHRGEVYLKLTEHWVLKKGNTRRTSVGSWLHVCNLTRLGTLAEAMDAMEALHEGHTSTEGKYGVWLEWDATGLPDGHNGPEWCRDKPVSIETLGGGVCGSSDPFKGRYWNWGGCTPEDLQIVKYKVERK